MKQVGFSTIFIYRIKLKSLSTAFSTFQVLGPTYIPNFKSGSHSSPLFPHLDPILHPSLPPLSHSVSLDCTSGTVQGQPPHAALGQVYICSPHWDMGSIRWGGAVCHFTFIFFRVSNTNSCIVGGAEVVVAKQKQSLHSHFTLYMLRPLLNKVHIWLRKPHFLCCYSLIF